MKQNLIKLTWPLFQLFRLDGIMKLYLGGLKDDGWFDSFRSKKAIDRGHRPIPWYTYPAIKFLKPRLHQNMSVYEYGCGNSTLWYSGLVKQVDAVEHDSEWFNHVVGSMPNNVDIRLKTDEKDYINDLNTRNTRYDLIVVDGLNRYRCAETAMSHLTEGGVILLDNSDKEKHRTARNFLDSTPLKCLDLWGLAPISARNSCTSIYYPASHNVLGI